MGPAALLQKSLKKDFSVPKDQNPAEKRVQEVTTKLIGTYKNKRMKVFHELARSRACLRSKNFFRIYTSVDNVSGVRKKTPLFKSKYHNPKPKSAGYPMDFDTLRGFKESSEELQKVQKYIDKMIAETMKKVQDKKLLEDAEKIVYHYPTLQELVNTNHILSYLMYQTLNSNFSLKERFQKHLYQKNAKDQFQMKFS